MEKPRKDPNRIVDICANPLCSKLGIEQSIDEFEQINKVKDWRRGQCKTCRQGHLHTSKNSVKLPKDPNRLVDICNNPSCSKSGIEQPINEFSWANKAKGYRQGRCKTCDAIRYTQSPDREKRLEQKRIKQNKILELLNKGLKKCSTCEEIKSLSVFNRRNKISDEYHSQCRECILAQRKEHSNIPEIKAATGAYMKTEKVKTRSSAYWKTPRGKAIHSAYDKTPKARAIHTRYVKNNPGKSNARTRRRRAAKLQRVPVWSEKEAIVRFYINCPDGMHVDHIIPLRGKLVSGLHVLSNLQYLTSSENCSKGNKYDPLDPFKWEKNKEDKNNK